MDQMTLGDNVGKRRKFADVVRIEAMDGGVIRVDDERRLLQEGMSRYDLSLEEARGVLLTTANDQGIVLQRSVDTEVAELVNLQATKGRVRKLSQADFEQAAQMYRAKTKGRISLPDARKRVKTMMEDAEIKPKRSGWIIRSKRWYNSVKT